MAFSFKSAERARRHNPKTTLKRRDDALLPFIGTTAEAGGALLLDTCVYIDQIRGTAPVVLDDLIAIRIVNHSSVAEQEMLFAVGALDPEDARSRKAVAAIGKAVEAMPVHRLHTADLDVLGRAAVFAGILSRTQGYARDDKMRALHDCVLFLQAMKLGLTVLTRNVADFDLLLQMCPDGRVLFYRT